MLVLPTERELFLTQLLKSDMPFWKKRLLLWSRLAREVALRYALALESRWWRIRMLFYKTTEEKMALHVCDLGCVASDAFAAGIMYCSKGGATNLIRVGVHRGMLSKEERMQKMQLLRTEASPRGLVEVPGLLAPNMFMPLALYRYCVGVLVGREVSMKEIVFSWEGLLQEIKLAA
ncbi:MAG: hypothetical protein A3I44_06380 [Candidatus Sungbacteria bacterium RIFCSPLOWO2_02_FULL_51_17]|nr:MAG: hypothetical protein A2676_01015 [Candidatus Sungbacteria bacterium RIFCSPHIGHO2_01_FULL_51_22]OHA11118.1 MAG: hypothetical protein A3I44_06380 [Candidatus Sungbacteria bacterium RIFCSPLOWO2_02_FULL_51_17]